MIELRVLGEIELRGAESARLDALMRLPKRLALLAYLACPTPGTWHRRDILLPLFWAELDTGRARTALRNALYVLRQHLGERIIRTRGDEELSIDPAELQTDAGALWTALRDERADEALALYRGELLPGLYPPESEGFVRWLDGERARLKVAVTAAATSRADAAERRGDHAAALAVVRRILEIQPDDETVVRRLVSLHDRLGDRAGALAAFEAYRKRLAAEFAAEPAPETVALVERLRESSRGTTAPPRPEPRALPRPRPAVEGGAATVAPAVPRDAGAAPGVEGAAPDPAASPRHTRRRTRLFTASAVVLAAVAFAARGFAPAARPQTIGTAAPLTSAEELEVEAAISPNGRLVAYARGSTTQLRIVVQRIGGGEPWLLTGDSSDAAEQMPRWSPDNDRILFLSRGQAWVAPSLGGTARMVARGIEGGVGAVRSAAWSPSGDSVAIVRNDSLLVLRVGGGGQRYVGRGRQLHSCEWSSTGAWIACVSGNWIAYEPGPLFGNRGQSAVVLFPATGGDAIDLTGADFQNDGPAWSADGRVLWIRSDREGVPGDVFATEVGRDGRARTPFVRVGLTSESISLARGRIAYSVPFRRSNVWAIPIPGDTVSALSVAGRRVTSGTQLIEVLSVSFDGRWLVYDSNLSGNADIFRVPIAGGAAERLVEDPRPDYCGVLSPDGRDLAWHRWSDGVRRLMVKRLDSDHVDSIADLPGDQGSPQWSPDGDALAAWSHENEEGALIVARRDAAGRWRRAWRLEGGQLPAWSRDGRSLAFVRYDGAIETIPADSGPRHRIYTPRPGSSDPIATYVYWRLDPSTIWFLGNDPAGHGGIWSVPAGGGAPRLRVRLDDRAGHAHGPSFTSDGANLYLTLDERFSQLWWAELRDR